MAVTRARAVVSTAKATAPRREVIAFANVMEKKLKENDWKGGSEAWRQDDVETLLRRLKEEVAELEQAVALGYGVPEEAADVGNFALMIQDWWHFNVGP